jgi:hypothetical protein
MKKILTAVLAVFLLLAVGCTKSPTDQTGPAPDPIAIAGKWLTWVSGNPYLCTITSTRYDYTNTGVDATIVKYDNTLRYCVLYWNQHPAYAGKYEKQEWTNLNPVFFTAYTYRPTNSIAAAELDTVRMITSQCSNRP